jgi:hypothetical protein
MLHEFPSNQQQKYLETNLNYSKLPYPALEVWRVCENIAENAAQHILVKINT